MNGSTAREHSQISPERYGAARPRAPKIHHAAFVAARELKCQPKTAGHYLAETKHIAAACVRALHAVGDHAAKEAFLKPILDAARGLTVQPLSDDLLLELSEADANENVARDAYELTKGKEERDTLIRKLRKQAALSNAVADALAAVEEP